ncbi:MAG TPA: hypothetical protein DIV86_00180 [Alphaproteobacteria bacterium]|nr:hypothetical protein [Alphaproteobacteria bacterium]
MIFSVYDKYGQIKNTHPRIALLVLAMLFFAAVYKNYDASLAYKQALKTEVEKNATSLLFAELTEENLEYYLAEPYCGYIIDSKSIKLNTINRDADGATIHTKEYSAGKDEIKITICYSVKKIEEKTQKHLLIIIILFITSVILTRRHFAYEKAKFYETANKEISDTPKR